jgi:hypothetical protein
VDGFDHGEIVHESRALRFGAKSGLRSETVFPPFSRALCRKNEILAAPQPCRRFVAPCASMQLWQQEGARRLKNRASSRTGGAPEIACDPPQAGKSNPSISGANDFVIGGACLLLVGVE